MTTVQIHQLHKTFFMGDQSVLAVNGVDLDVLDGSFTVIMGPSGSGKSTLLYLIGGLEYPTSGSIVVDGDDVGKMSGQELAEYRKKKVGFVFQSFYLLPTMTSLENVAFPMRFAGVPTRQRKERAEVLLTQVGLHDRMKHLPTELSGGQQQRVAIARALANNPRLILGDEPTGNLDRKLGAEIIQLLLKFHNEGRTVILVTHDPTIADLATQVVYMLDGLIVSKDEYMKNVSLVKTPAAAVTE
jgi:putative ABC transport system ATP-binding protein